MKKLKKEKTKANKSRLILFGSFLIIGICTLTISLTLLNNYKNDKEEDKNLNDFFEVQEQINIEQKEVIEEKQEQKEEVKHYDTESYLGVLEIKKIGLTKGFYSINSKNNRVNKTIQIIKESKMPDEDKGNLIIAGHSGNAYISYFRNLNKLSYGDIATVYYNGRTYNYKLVNTYEIEKTGTAHIKRNGEKNTLTLITCKHNTNKQLVFIFELNEII